MKNLTTPKAILFGLGLIALSIASLPYSSNIVKPAYASNCDMSVVQMAIEELTDVIKLKY